VPRECHSTDNKRFLPSLCASSSHINSCLGGDSRQSKKPRLDFEQTGRIVSSFEEFNAARV